MSLYEIDICMIYMSIGMFQVVRDEDLVEASALKLLPRPLREHAVRHEDRDLFRTLNSLEPCIESIRMTCVIDLKGFELKMN